MNNPRNNRGRKKRGGFTLVELLIVIGIVGVLAAVVIITINPAELIKQARDSTRLSDIDTINKALTVTQTDSLALGSANTVYVSIPSSFGNCSDLGLPTLPSGWSYACVTSANLRRTDGNGWVPVNLTASSIGSPIGVLPVDPTNTSSSNLYYTYTTSGINWTLQARAMESAKQIAANPNGFTLGNGPAIAGPYVYPQYWVYVPGNATFGTSGFYVMKYAAKCVQTSSNTPYGTPSAAYDTGYRTYSNSGYPCTGSNYVASTPDGFPIANISHNTALSYCTALGAHLLTNDEYMTIVTNAAGVSSNWSGGSVGSGVMPRGNSNSSAAQYDGTNQYGTGYSDFTHLRTMTLSNGSVVWDMAGNVWEHVQRSTMNSGDNTTAMNLPSCSSGTGWQWCQYGNSTTPYVTTWNDASFSAATVGPPNSSWNSSQNMGQVYTYAPGGSQGTTVFLRGGNWFNGTNDGPFTLYLIWGTGGTSYNVGFRCAR